MRCFWRTAALLCLGGAITFSAGLYAADEVQKETTAASEADRFTNFQEGRPGPGRPGDRDRNDRDRDDRGPRPGGPRGPQARPDLDRRIANMERKLDEILREIRELKNQRGPQRGPEHRGPAPMFGRGFGPPPPFGFRPPPRGPEPRRDDERRGPEARPSRGPEGRGPEGRRPEGDRRDEERPEGERRGSEGRRPPPRDDENVTF